MGRITFTAGEHHEDIIADVEAQHDCDSTAAAVRTCIELADEVQQARNGRDERVQQLEEQVEALETERDRLQRELAATNRRVDEHQELVEYVEEERQLERQRRTAGIVTRTKWWLVGMPEDEDG